MWEEGARTSPLPLFRSPLLRRIAGTEWKDHASFRAISIGCHHVARSTVVTSGGGSVSGETRPAQGSNGDSDGVDADTQDSLCRRLFHGRAAAGFGRSGSGLSGVGARLPRE